MGRQAARYINFIWILISLKSCEMVQWSNRWRALLCWHMCDLKDNYTRWNSFSQPIRKEIPFIFTTHNKLCGGKIGAVNLKHNDRYKISWRKLFLVLPGQKNPTPYIWSLFTRIIKMLHSLFIKQSNRKLMKPYGNYTEKWSANHIYLRGKLMLVILLYKEKNATVHTQNRLGFLARLAST